MKEATKSYLVWGIFALAILLPRIALLVNGLDSQRIWDTNTPAAFRFLQAAQEGKWAEFFSVDQKYPLLGSYVYIPVIGAYYGVGRASGSFGSADAFVDAFAVGGTQLFFWLRLEVLLLHLGALALLFFLTKRFTNDSLRAGVYALVFAAADFYLAMFSVTPRIHSFAFVGAMAALFTSLLLLQEKSLRNYLLAFGAAGVAASLSQSGFPTLILPLLAHALSPNGRGWHVKHHSAAFCVGAALLLFIVLFLGYPRFFPVFLARGDVLSVFLSGEHSQPMFGIRNIIRFLREYAFGAAFAVVWTILAGFWYAFCARRKYRMELTAYDWLAIAHVSLFGLLFGFSDVLSGRFLLAALPSVFFLCARAVLALEKRKAFLYILTALLAVQAFGIGLLTMVAFGGDTRAQAAKFVLANTNENDKLLANLDTELLGLVPAPHSVSVSDTGLMDQRIRERDLVGSKTRQIALWHPKSGTIQEEILKEYTYIIVASDHPDRYLAEEILTRNNFKPAATFYATRKEDPRLKSFIAWDMIAPVPRVPYPLKLRAFRAMGPTIVVYERI